VVPPERHGTQIVEMKQNILDTILETKRKEISALHRRIDLSDARARAAAAAEPRDFFAAVAAPPRRSANLIAEIKMASPSAGLIRPDFNPSAIARQYAFAGADALSVLTDEQYFHGSLAHLGQVRRVVELPLLRKDFIIDPLQVYQARWAGADAVLLIVAALGPPVLRQLLQLANELNMTCLVEVHNSDELSGALGVLHEAPRNLLGINNRDLTTFQVDIEATVRLAAQAGGDLPIVSESGIKTRSDVDRLAQAGVRAVLVGETLMRSDDPAAAVERLMGPPSD